MAACVNAAAAFMEGNAVFLGRGVAAIVLIINLHAGLSPKTYPAIGYARALEVCWRRNGLTCWCVLAENPLAAAARRILREERHEPLEGYTGAKYECRRCGTLLRQAGVYLRAKAPLSWLRSCEAHDRCAPQAIARLQCQRNNARRMLPLGDSTGLALSGGTPQATVECRNIVDRSQSLTSASALPSPVRQGRGIYRSPVNELAYCRRRGIAGRRRVAHGVCLALLALDA